MNETIEPPPTSNAVDRPSLPPLRIHHFLIWTAVLAVSLALFGWSRIQPAEMPAWAVAVNVVSYVLSSAAVTCVGFGIAWRLQGLRYPSEPGHWIAIGVTFGMVVGAIIATLYAAYRPPDEDWGLMWRPDWVKYSIRWFSILAGVLLGILYIAVAAWFVSGWRWKLVFCLATTLSFGNAALQAFFFVFMQYVSRGNVVSVVRWLNISVDAVPTLLLLLLLAAACIHDRRMHYARHWSHWVGIGVWGIDDSIKIVRYVAAYLLGEF